MANQYADVNDMQFAGLLQVATAAADAQQRSAQALGKRRRDEESTIDHQLRQPLAQPFPHHTPQPANATPTTPVLQNAAAVIFREPSEKSKKYSRPPLGKVFSDMQLSPEAFLRLQNAAKAFMLDTNYPERLNVVGQRKESGNNDVAKLKLWTCVEEFLEKDYNGEKYFGYDACAETASGNRRSSYWPQDREKVIKLCMPLFRKMVTNERQRLYASETRRQDSTKPNRNKQLPATSQPTPIIKDNTPTHNTPTQQHAMGLKYDTAEAATDESPETVVKVHLNLVSSQSKGEVRVAPRVTVPSSEVQTIEELFSVVEQEFDLTEYREKAAIAIAALPDFLHDRLSTMPFLKVMMPDGYLDISSNAVWVKILEQAKAIEWLDNELRVVVEV